MNLALSLAVLAILAAACASPSPAVRPPSGHPLIGKWEWTRKANNCTEVYEFKTDGSVPVVSGTERTDNTYTVSAAADNQGFYLMTIRTTRDKGGKDCGEDESDSTGVESTTFVIFNPARDQHIVCYEANFERCFGPLRRVAP